MNVPPDQPAEDVTARLIPVTEPDMPRPGVARAADDLLRGVATRRTDLHRLARAVGLDEKAAATIAEQSTMDSSGVRSLVDSGIVNPALAGDLRLAADVYQLTGEPTLAAALTTAELPDRGGPVRSLRELAALDDGGWRRVADAARDRDTTDALRERVEKVFPGDALLSRLTPRREQLLADLSRREGDAAARLGALANAYPGLGLGTVIADEKLGTERQATEITTRIGALRQLMEAHPELLRFDLSPGSSDLDTLGDIDRGQLTAVKAHQRAYHLAGDVDIAQRLLEADLHSRYAVAGLRVEELAARTGLDEAPAAALHGEATRTAAALTGVFGGVLDLGTAHSGQIYQVVPPVPVLDYLRGLDGFADLFGSQAACDCGHCESLLGPAAYFADLMLFVQQHVSGPLFSGARAGHAMALRTRRPDLWEIPLTCENTLTLIPSLDIINGICENYIATSRGYPANQLSNRPAVGKAVYEQAVAVSHESVRLPFSLPLARLSGYLGLDETTRAAIVELVGARPPVLAAARLELSTVDYDLITTPNTDLTFLREVFGLPLVPDPAGTIPAFDAQDLVRAIEMPRDQLGQLLTTRFLAAGGPVPTIHPEKATADSVQNDIERVRGLTAANLDRLHRFIRLWHRLQWTVTELDLVLTALGATALGPAELAAVAEVRAVQRRLELPVAEVCALAGVLADVVAVPDEPTPFDRLFNPSPFLAQDGEYPKSAATFLHPALRPAGAAAPVGPTQHRLQAALGVTEAELLTLIRGLRTPLGVNPDATDPAQRAFALTAANLCILYQHARLARVLGVSIVDLFRLLGPAPAAAAGAPKADPAALLARLARYDQWQASGRTLDDLDVLARRSPTDPTRYPDPATIVTGLLGEIATERALTFADTVFAFLDRVTEDASRDIIAANPTRIVPAGGDRYRLADSFDLATPLAVPAGITLDAAAVRDLLATYHPSRVLPSKLAGRLRVPGETVSSLLALLGADLTAGALPAALHAAQAAPLVALVADLVPLVTLLPAVTFTPADVAYVAAHQRVIGLADPRQITEDTVRAVAVVASTVDELVPARDTLGVLLAYTQNDGFTLADQAVLARVTRAPAGLLPGLVRGLPAPAGTTAADALRRLLDCTALAQKLGVGGETLALAASTNYADQSTAADALLAALRARHPDDLAKGRLEPVEDGLRSRCRDALTDFLIHSSFPQFTSREDLYQHFLIDVELQGCVRTSRVVSATSSVQLYVYRCLMNLESDRRGDNDPAHVHVPPSAIPAEEWAWRKNYRVWEANRKVFLWPENYLEPELRDDKTPLFADLEATLLQKPIDEQSVLDAYSAYLSGFEELARLKIAGSCHEKDPVNKTDVLHLFGVSQTDPPTFYYRAVRDAHYGVSEPDPARGTIWEPWRRIDVQVGARTVSPIVIGGRLHLFWVEWSTKPQNQFVNGNSTFVAYQHTIGLKFSVLRLDGTWTAPQKVSLKETTPFVGDGVLFETVFTDHTARFDWERWDHTDPRDGYGPHGWHFDTVYPFLTSRNELCVAGAGFQMEVFVDLRTRKSWWDVPFRVSNAAHRHLYAHSGTSTRTLNYLTKASALSPDFEITSFYLDGQRLGMLRDLAYSTADIIERTWGPQAFLAMPPGTELAVVNGSTEDCVLDVNGDQLYLQGSVYPAPRYLIRRLGTQLADDVAAKLFTDGVDGLLDIDYQVDLNEPPMPVSGLVDVAGQVAGGTLDTEGPYGVYYREIFLHIPYLLARHLSSQGKHEAAQRWFHYLFDPTATETIDIPPGLSPAGAAHRALDRNWRYREFRGLGIPNLREMLTQKKAIAAYQRDPFNPHAIARLRLSAYQKNLVLSYVDNLVDWADSLFAQFTTESVNEATLLYQTAAQILGDRPPLLGECGDGTTGSRTYEALEKLLEKGGPFLAELETVLIGGGGSVRNTQYAQASTGEVDALALAGVAFSAQAMTAANGSGTTDPYGWSKARISHWERAAGREVAQLDHTGLRTIDGLSVASFGRTVIRHTAVFCVPRNPELDRRWQRVADQLFKIRNCLDITGARRQLALFAPEIDPRLLVRARASGLSLDDVLGATAGNLPPYRFPYLIERAKSQASLVQSFGGALLSALEKKDVEELTRLRAVQQQNLLKLATQARRWDIKVAEDAIEVLERQRTAAQYRYDYYQGLADQNLIASERRQSDARNIASGLSEAAGILDLAAGIAHLVPQLGAPTAMKFGGMEIGNSLKSFSQLLRTGASVAEAESAAAGLQATFERRREGWLHQVTLIGHELGQLGKQIAAAGIHRDIAVRSLELHEATMAQADEVYAFYGDKFTGLGLYTWLAQTLQRVYREAYNGAYAMARLAEQAFRFERGDDTSPLLDTSYWDPARAGLLAGDRLLIDVQAMERRFIETNYRTLEMDQALSLTVLDPAALVTLRETGTCDFAIDEFHYDLLYPGHYRRRIKSVRLTIPCVTGPYTNVSAALTLLGSTIRTEPATVIGVPLRRSTSIATSTAQQDAGVFEFSFRDERYMPFEGAGATSSWRLTLPKSLHAFDYRTITDVILHVTYTAEADEIFRAKVEGVDTLAGSLRYRVKNAPQTRVLSLRHDFSSAYQRLLASPAGSAVPVRIGYEHFPLYLDRKTLAAATVRLALVPRKGQALGSFRAALDGVTHAVFPAESSLGGLPTATVTAGFATPLLGAHTIAVPDPGGFAPTNPVPGDPAAVDPNLLEDVLLVIAYTAS